MRVLCSSVLGIEAIVILLATSLVASSGQTDRPAVAWVAGVVLMALLLLAAGALRRPWGLTLGWILQAIVMASALLVGWTMLVVGAIFVVLWWLAIQNGSRVDALRARRPEPGEQASGPAEPSP